VVYDTIRCISRGTNPRLLITPMSQTSVFSKIYIQTALFELQDPFLYSECYTGGRGAQPFIDLSTDSATFVLTAEAAVGSSFLQALFCCNLNISLKPFINSQNRLTIYTHPRIPPYSETRRLSSEYARLLVVKHILLEERYGLALGKGFICHRSFLLSLPARLPQQQASSDFLRNSRNPLRIPHPIFPFDCFSPSSFVMTIIRTLLCPLIEQFKRLYTFRHLHVRIVSSLKPLPSLHRTRMNSGCSPVVVEVLERFDASQDRKKSMKG
jgi:hypothetical protein